MTDAESAPDSDPDAAAAWMVTQIEERGWLAQHRAVRHIALHFGKELTYRNQNGNSAIDKRVLDAFRKLTEDSVIWERGTQRWRRRRPNDPEGRQRA